MGSKKLQVWLPVLFAVTIILGMLIGYQLREETTGGKFLGFSKRTSLQEVVDLVKSRYVDKVASDSINQLAVNQLLAHLDPHSILIPTDQLSAADEHLQDNIKGIGIEFQVIDDTVNVMNVIKKDLQKKLG